jgi:hypothetical protein
MHLEGPMTMTHKHLRSGLSLLAAALTGAVAPTHAADKEPNTGNISPALAREIAADSVGAEGSRERPSDALVGRAGR